MGSVAACLGRGGQQGSRKFFVEREKEFNALTVGVERLGTVAFLHGSIQFGMGFRKSGWRGERIVDVSECAKSAGWQMRLARSENGSRFCRDAVVLRGGHGRPWKIVVNNPG
jgi:hypothetical protein